MSEQIIFSLPKHRNPEQNRTASAPYNFVPLPGIVVTAVDSAEDLPGHDRYETGKHTGYFDVTLTTKSPLYVRCPFTLEEFLRQERGDDEKEKLPFRQQVKNTPHFFYTRDPGQPVIPGSSLRGMLRSLLEIASYGKVQWVTDKRLIYRAVGDRSSLGQSYREKVMGPNKTKPPNMHFDYPSLRLKGGYLRRQGSGWAIQPAKEIEGESFVRVEYNDALPIIGGQGRQLVHDVFVKPVPRVSSNRGKRGRGDLTLDVAITPRVSATSKNGLIRAKLVESGHMGGVHPKHWHCAIYEPDPKARLIPIPGELWQLYEEDRDLTRGLTTRKLSQDGDPLFYLLDKHNDLVFFGPTMMFRLPYANSPLKLVPEELRRSEEIDYAEVLFGFVRTREELDNMKERGIVQEIPKQGEKMRAYAGRVFVTDAMLVEGQTDIWLSDDAIVPKILASPKPTAFQHYLVQTNSEKSKLKHYDSKTPGETVIRGHKRYWLQGERSGEDIREDGEIPDNSTQNTQFKPVKPGVKFKFRIYFENLSERELGALCWVLHPLGDLGKEYCHQLGMGKPLGMGAVKLEETLHLTDRVTRYSSLFDGDNWQTGLSGPGESLSDRANLERRTRKFEEHILDRLKPNKPCRHLCELKRIAMLLKMMEWPGYSPVPSGLLFLPEEGRPNTRYMKIQPKNEFKDRPVLPDPSAFGSLTGDAEPSSPATSSDTSPGLAEREKALSSTVSAESVRKLIKGLRGPGEVSRIPEIVKQIEKLSDPAERCECAEMLRQWLHKHKLWNKEPHASAEWRKQVEQWLKD